MGHRRDVHREDLCTCSAGRVGGRTRVGICLFRGSAAADSLRQHEAGGGQDSGGGERKKTRAFCELQSHCLFKEKFGRPGKGNDKGKVEGLVGYARRNFLVPIPRVGSWEKLNTHLREQCGKQ